MILLRLAAASLMGRWITVSLTIPSIALSTALFLGVEKVRTGAEESFSGKSRTRISSSARGRARCSSCSTRSFASATPPTT